MTDRITTAARYSRRQALAAGTAALAGALFCSAEAQEKSLQDSIPTDQPNIVVFIADTLRRDHLGCYGYPLATSPNIDAMAESALLFEKCYTQTPWTKPSVSSLFTGYLPRIHQAVLTTYDIPNLEQWDESNPHEYKIQTLRTNFTTLAEALQNQGYNTGCFQWSPHCQEHFGFGQGFNHYQFVPEELPEDQINAAVSWIESQSTKPFFLFIHEREPHGIYTPPDSFYSDVFEKTRKEAEAEISAEDLYLIEDFSPDSCSQLSPSGLDFLKTLYDAEIREADYFFGRILNSLAKQKLDNNTVVIFTSDHGEAFGEHGFFKHNNSLYDEEIHVPLIIHVGTQQKKIRVPWTVSMFDLYATVLSLANVPCEPTIQSKSLLSAEGKLEVNKDRSVCAYFDRNDPNIESWECCLIEAGLKIYDKGLGIAPEIYDRRNDPQERNNLFGKLQDSEELMTRVKRLRAEHDLLAQSFGEPQYAGIDQASMDELRSLGYF